jgi:hypothetical protein
VLAAPVELGLGAREALSLTGTGRVVGAFTRAAYVQAPGGLFAVTSLDVPPGPLHARSAVALDRLQVGDPAVVTPSLLQAGPLLLDLAAARTWCGASPAAADLEANRDLARELLDAAPPSALPDMAVRSAVGRLAAGDLEATAAVLGGAGPGLTPAGDDCLAGIFLMANVRWGGAATTRLVQIADGVATNDVARAFLRWAARGQSIDPVHRFLVSVPTGDRHVARQALDAVLAMGHSSGTDLALGLRLGLLELPPTERCNARATG